MQRIEITGEEAGVLRQLLEHALKEMDVEVHRTDKLDYKRMLKERRDQVEHVLSKLNAFPTAAAA